MLEDKYEVTQDENERKGKGLKKEKVKNEAIRKVINNQTVEITDIIRIMKNLMEDNKQTKIRRETSILTRTN